MRNFYIYHVPGIKIGVTTNVPKRMKQQGFTEWEHLETHTCVYEVSDREQELQRQYGYRVDTTPYHVTYLMGKNNKGTVPSEDVITRRTSHLTGNDHAKGFVHTKEAKESISKAVLNRPEIECPKCKKIMRGNSKFRQHYDSIKCKKAAKLNE